MSDAGYVRIFRSLIGHPAFRNDAEAMAFAWMVIRAAWRPVRVRYKERTINLERGQLAISVRDMAAALDRDKAWIERLWKRLKSETMVTTCNETGVSIVTICNYEEYQGEQDTGETPRKTRHETGARQARDTEQRREEGKKEEEDASASSSRAHADAFPDDRPASAKPRKSKPDGIKPHPMPADWQPGPLPPSVAALTAQWPPGRLEREAEACRDYWLDRPDKRPGWDRTFHNRIRDIHDRVLKESRNDRSQNHRAEPAKPSGNGLTEILRRRGAYAGLGID